MEDPAEVELAVERKLRLWAPPAVLALAWLAMRSDGWRGFARTVLTMWVHELGHAVTAWLSGFAALPAPWRTAISDGRRPWVSLLVLLALGALAHRCWRRRSHRLLVVLGVVLALQVVCTLALRPQQARALISFGGDAGMQVLGVGLMATFWVPRDSHLHTSWLRWGFLVIGAFAFMDSFSLWVAARHHHDLIPFGEIEGVGASDPSRLTDEFGWSVAALVSRYVALGSACLVVLAALYGNGLRRTEIAAQAEA